MVHYTSGCTLIAITVAAISFDFSATCQLPAWSETLICRCRGMWKVGCGNVELGLGAGVSDFDVKVKVEVGSSLIIKEP
jgi:hypothetical protein